MLKERFPRLFRLSARIDGTINDMGKWVNGEWKWEVQWKMSVLDKEREKDDELLQLLQMTKIRERVDDRWIWGEKSEGRYTVQETYNLIQACSGQHSPRTLTWDVLDYIWKAFAPLKAKVTTWRIAWNRLPICNNVEKRINLERDQTRCCCCNIGAESVAHLFSRMRGNKDSVEQID